MTLPDVKANPAPTNPKGTEPAEFCISLLNRNAELVSDPGLVFALFKGLWIRNPAMFSPGL